MTQPALISNQSQPVPQSFLNNYNSYQIDQANTMLTQFASSLGYPQWLNDNLVLESILSWGFEARGEAAFAELFKNFVPADQQAAYPGAKFGMAFDDYNQAKDALDSQWQTHTGMDSAPQELLDMAIGHRWSSTQVQQYAEQHFQADQPWLGAGQTFQQAKQSYVGIYGSAPPDAKTLAAWYTFGQQMKHVGGGGEAVRQPTQAPSQPTPRPGSESEVR